MRSRAELLTEIVEQVLPTSSTIEELKAYGWDSRVVLVTLTKSHIRSVLGEFEQGSITAAQVRDWANRLEHRDDLAYEDGGEGVVNEALFWLANPAINGALDDSISQRIEVLFASQ